MNRVIINADDFGIHGEVNKAVVSAHFEEFMTLAAEAGVNFTIEACVCGGIPWIAGIQKVRRIDEISAFLLSKECHRTRMLRS